MQLEVHASMNPLKKKWRGSAGVDNSELQQVACSCDDGASTSSFAKHFSFKDCMRQRKLLKEKIVDKQLDSSYFHPTADATFPPPRRGVCLYDTTPKGIKRKCGCIEEATQTRRDQNIESQYHMGQALGRGKFGVIRLCKNRVNGEELACKSLPKYSAENAYNEVEVMQHLSGHPNVVTLRAVYEDADSLHLVMDFCSGGRLVDSMKKGCYSEHGAAKLIKQLVAVIQYCHEMGVVHRDIKPENVLLTGDGQMKLSDFGLSVHVANAQNLSGLVGSAAYVAPEVLAGPYTEKVDVWGAGVVLHALLIGALPFRGDSVEAIFEAVKTVQLDFQTEKWESVSAPAKDLLSRMLSRDVEKRLSPEDVLSHPWVLFYTDSELFKEPKALPPYKPDKTQDAINSNPKEPTEECICRNLKNSSLVDAVELALLYSSENPDYIQEQGCDLVDVLSAAISQMKISKPKSSRLDYVPAYLLPVGSAFNSRMSLCRAF